jgi:hypothetical protein
MATSCKRPLSDGGLPPAKQRRCDKPRLDLAAVAESIDNGTYESPWSFEDTLWDLEIDCDTRRTGWPRGKSFTAKYHPIIEHHPSVVAVRDDGSRDRDRCDKCWGPVVHRSEESVCNKLRVALDACADICDDCRPCFGKCPGFGDFAGGHVTWAGGADDLCAECWQDREDWQAENGSDDEEEDE